MGNPPVSTAWDDFLRATAGELDLYERELLRTSMDPAELDEAYTHLLSARE